MLMTVLRGELATQQTKILIRTFKQMKDFIVKSNNLLSTDNVIKLVNQVNENTSDINEIKNKLEIVMDNFIVYQSVGSIKYAGNKMTAINKLEFPNIYESIVLMFLNNEI